MRILEIKESSSTERKRRGISWNHLLNTTCGGRDREREIERIKDPFSLFREKKEKRNKLTREGAWEILISDRLLKSRQIHGKLLGTTFFTFLGF